MKKERSLFASVRTFSRKICRSVGQIYSPLTTKVKGPQRKIKAVAAAGVLGVAAAVTSLSVMGCPSPHDSTKDQPPILYQTWGVTGIDFYKGPGISDQDMDDFIDMIKDEYAIMFNLAMQVSFSANLTEIHLRKDGDKVSHQGSVLYVRDDATMADIVPYLIDKGIMVISRIQQKDIIRLAKAHAQCQSPKHTHSVRYYDFNCMERLVR